MDEEKLWDWKCFGWNMSRKKSLCAIILIFYRGGGKREKTCTSYLFICWLDKRDSKVTKPNYKQIVCCVLYHTTYLEKNELKLNKGIITERGREKTIENEIK